MANSTTTLLAGANAALAQEQYLEVTIQWTDSPVPLDTSCFMIQANGKVPSDDYFIFYNQPADPASLVQLKASTADHAVFSISLDGLWETRIEKCVFAATLDGAITFNQIASNITASTSQTNVVFEVKEAGDETSLVFMELYRHQAWWKVRAIGKGFNGGLQPLAEAYGVSVAEDEAGETGEAADASKATVAAARTSVQDLASTKSVSVFASQPGSASIFALQDPAKSVFALQPHVSVFASQNNRDRSDRTHIEA